MPHIIASTYEILEKLGSGGGGIVYLGRHLRLETKVALKAEKRKLSGKFNDEVETLRNLRHMNIPRVYDFIPEDDVVYTVMDYIEGESLDAPLKRGERFSQAQVIELARPLLEALVYLHGPHPPEYPYGLLHSDIKPANIMLTPKGEVWLIDFNIALALGEEGAVAVGYSSGYASPEHYGRYYPSVSKKNSVETTAVMAPETADMNTHTMPQDMAQSADSSGTSKIKTIVLDARSDIYGLGATLYHLLTGRRPPKDAVDVEPLSEKEFSPMISAIINKAMAPDPDMRYQTAEEMLFDLNHIHQKDPRMKKFKKTALIIGLSLSALIISSVFTSFVGLKRMERIQNYYALAEYSSNALSRGDVPLAVSLALEALPEKNSIFIPPHTSAAIKALTDALGVYDLSDSYKPFNTITMPSETFKVAMSGDGKTAVAVYAFEITVFDTDTTEVIAKLPITKSALTDAKFINDTTLVYGGENGITAYDTANRKELWTGVPATGIAVSADQKVIAAVYRDESGAVIYNADGSKKSEVAFDGKKQRVAQNDIFADPGYNLFALNKDGSLLAVSFEDGSLKIFDLINDDNSIEIFDSSEFVHFEGGFSDIYFAFSATDNDSSVFAVIDTQEVEQLGGFEAPERFGVLADETGIFISFEDVVVKLNPVSGDQENVAYTEYDVIKFDISSNGAIVATKENEYVFFDKNANQLVKYSGDSAGNFVNAAGNYAIVGGRDTPLLKILKYENNSDTSVSAYDNEYIYSEVRINAEGSRTMLFSYSGFQLYDANGKLLNETSIPDAELVYDQQYSKNSGNLAVIYENALRIYSGDTGKLLFEKTDLKSTFYAPYGISVFEQNGVLSLIDMDSAEVLSEYQAAGDFAAFCGMVIDSEFLKDKELIGAAKNSNGFFFVIGDEIGSSVYNGDGKNLFDIVTTGKWEAFFTEDAVIISPLHGTPTAYSLKTGKKINDLEKDSYLAYITQIGEHVVSEYMSLNGERFAILLDSATFEPLAHLPGLTDITGNELLFDYRLGDLRKSRIYSFNELISIAKSGEF